MKFTPWTEKLWRLVWLKGTIWRTLDPCTPKVIVLNFKDRHNLLDGNSLANLSKIEKSLEAIKNDFYDNSNGRHYSYTIQHMPMPIDIYYKLSSN